MTTLLPQALEYAEADESFFGESYASETDHSHSSEEDMNPNYMISPPLKDKNVVKQLIIT